MSPKPKSQGKMLYPGVVLHGGELLVLQRTSWRTSSALPVRDDHQQLSSASVDNPVDREKKSSARLYKRTV